jgi:sigma-B regulation protein RsbU (phosphoserine phosphatase)
VYKSAAKEANAKEAGSCDRLRDFEKSYLRSLERELEFGREIQAGFLPKTIPQPPGWEIEACFRPAREVAGDFYDVFELDEVHLVVLLGDVRQADPLPTPLRPA